MSTTSNNSGGNVTRAGLEGGAARPCDALATEPPQPFRQAQGAEPVEAGRVGPPSTQETPNAKTPNFPKPPRGLRAHSLVPCHLSLGTSSAARQRGSVLIIVIWICFGLVALTLYFANSMSSELRAADNRVDAAAARQALLGGIRYVEHTLALYGTNGTPPLSTDYKAEALPVGDAYFWIIGRDEDQKPTKDPVFGLVDEASKLNLNSATRGTLEGLPGMTPDLAAAIVAWHTGSGSGTTSSGDNTYAQLTPPRRIKHAPFESVDELRLVYGATLDLLFGEDTNRNGVIDLNEDDGDQTAPHDDQNGQLNPGILEYVTVYSQQPNTRSDGSPRIDISTPLPQNRIRLQALLRGKFSVDRVQQIMGATATARPFTSVAEFYARSGMTADEFAQIHTDITVATGTSVRGLVNINTASETVLTCLPGLDVAKAATIVAYRLAHASSLTSLAWLKDVITPDSFRLVGPYITDQSYQFSADIAAVARSGRGYCRQRVVFDLSKGTPRIVYRQDLTAAGWALGANVRQSLKTAKGTWQ